MDRSKPADPRASQTLAIIVILWVVLGAAGFIMSVRCFNFKSSDQSNLGGLLVAMVMGPLYWVYYALNKRYCLPL